MRRLLLAGLLASVAVAGCSSDDPGDGRSDAAPRTTAPAAPKEVAARPSEGCDRLPVDPAQTEVQLGERSYIRTLPPDADGPVPLVVDIHGYQEGARVHVEMTQLPSFGAEHGFATILPQGTDKPVRWYVELDSPDVAFFDELLDHAEQTMCIDTARIYVTGLSNGGNMTTALACTHADRFAAAAAVAGATDPDGCEPSRPIPFLAIHGTDDEFLRYEGGFGERGLDLPAADGSGRSFRELGAGAADGVLVEGASRPEIMASWAVRNGCDAETTETKIGEDVVRKAWACPAGADVELYTVIGGGHAWPGSAFSASVEAINGRTTMTIDADQVIWEFFQQHDLPRP